MIRKSGLGTRTHCTHAHTIFQVHAAANYASQIALATDREWLMLRSVYYAQEMQLHGASDGITEPTRVRLLADLKRIALKREQLYFGTPTLTGHHHTIGAGYAPLCSSRSQ